MAKGRVAVIIGGLAISIGAVLATWYAGVVLRAPEPEEIAPHVNVAPTAVDASPTPDDVSDFFETDEDDYTPPPPGLMAHLFDEYDGDDDVLARVGDLELARRELRQQSQESEAYSEFYGDPEDMTREERQQVVVLNLLDGLQMYHWAITLGLRETDAEVDKYIEDFRNACSMGTEPPCDDIWSMYGLTFDSYWEWKYEATRAAMSIGNLRSEKITVPAVGLIVEGDAEAEAKAEEFRKAGEALLQEAREKFPIVWLDAETERIYLNALENPATD